MSSESYNNMEQDDYVKISDTEDTEFMEFPKEDDETIMLSTLQAQFPHAIGLKYRGPSGAWRAIRAVDNVLDPPKGGWGAQVYCLTSSGGGTKSTGVQRVERENKISHITVNPLLKDLAVIRLPFATTEDEVREYFEKNFGELAMCEVKIDRETGKSRGFGFVRFRDEETAKEALSADHYKLGRLVEVRQKKDKPMKMFIGRLPHGITVEDVEKYFSQFGEVKDTFIPQPFRNFAFITMGSQEDGNAVLRQIHTLDGVRLNVEERKPDAKALEKTAIANVNSMFSSELLQHNTAANFNPNNVSFDALNGNGQPGVQHGIDMSSDLKNMLFEFLATQK